MKTKFKYLLLILAMLSFVSCESFLDMPETEEETFEKIWQDKDKTEQYLFTVYYYLYDELVPTSAIEIGAADESSCSWSTSGYAFSYLNAGSWSVTYPAGERFATYYAGIREANVFMQNVYTCSAYNITQTVMDQWYWEARFLRARYYFDLVKMYGPVTLLYDEIIDPNTPLEDMFYQRNSWEECVDWICGEFDECAENLPEIQTVTSSYGRPTSVTALALKARLLLYSARDLFNGNKAYQNLINPDGTAIFSTVYDENKWVIARDAAKAAIDAAHTAGHALHYTSTVDLSDEHAVYYSLKELNFDAHWNTEQIWAQYHSSNWFLEWHTTPRNVGSGICYGGWGPTQSQVDAYGTSEGIYPIIGYDGEEFYTNQRSSNNAGETVNGVTGKQTGVLPVIDPISGYNESGYTSFTNPSLAQSAVYVGAQDTYNMYVNREPRFYAHVTWGNSAYVRYSSSYASCVQVTYHSGGTSGNDSHDYPWTGAMVKKYTNEDIDADNSSFTPIMKSYVRLGEVYLNYAEACAETGDLDIAIEYVNMIRDRAGVPQFDASGAEYTDTYGTTMNYVNHYDLTDKAEVRELVRRERRIELAFESNRYYDTRQWLIAEDTDGGPIYGMNVLATDSDFDSIGSSSSFWTRYSPQTRVFLPQHYLYPFNQSELDRNDLLVQNYAW